VPDHPSQLERLTSALASRYRIERELGHGGMATVYLAEDLKHHRKVAVKVLRPELAAVLGAERFLKEIEVTANLQHPQILPLHDSGEADSFLYYVMPYVEGESLRDKLRREKQLGVEESIEIATAVASALDYAHRRGVIHRDIKPENILLHETQPVVTDFGIALAVTAAGGTRLTETGLSLGTPEYMSPEQATGDRELDARSDVYSLGAVVYEMLTGDPPHSGNTIQAIIAKVVSEEPTPITRTRKLVPANVEAAVQRALAKVPADRFATAAQFAEALGNPAFRLPTTQVAAVGARAADWQQRIAVPVAALAVLFGVVALWGWLRPQPEVAKPASRYGIVLPEGETREAPPFGGSGLALSPDGSRFVYAGPGERGTQLWVRSRDELHARPLPGTDGAYNPFFSPDGSRVGFFVGDAIVIKLMVASLRGGVPAPLADADSGVDWVGGSWGPDGFLYIDGQLEGDGLARVPEAGGRAEPVTMPDTAQGEAWHTRPDVLQNGKGVLFTISRGGDLREYEIAVVNLATATYEVLVRGTHAVYAASGHVVYTTPDGTLMAVPFDQNDLSLTGEPTALADRVHVSGLVGLSDFDVSTNGTLMYATGPPAGALDGLDQVAWVARDGTAEVIESAVRGSFRDVALSPDGTRLALGVWENGQGHVWIKQLAQGPLQKLTVEGPWNWAPSWMADGRSVTFSGLRGQKPAAFFQRRADGSGTAHVVLDHETVSSAAGELRGAWSRDGQWFVYRGGDGLYALRPDVDSVPVPLVDSRFHVSWPTLAPNGRWLAYVSDESGTNEVYVVPFPNTRDGKWLVSTGGGVAPVWAHSGRKLFYWGGRGKLMVVEVSTEAGFAIGARQALFSLIGDRQMVPWWWSSARVSYDVALDDQRFVMLQSSRSGHASAELIVVENFFEELKAKVGN
jgi:serine/threonine-protein kinase